MVPSKCPPPNGSLLPDFGDKLWRQEGESRVNLRPPQTNSADRLLSQLEKLTSATATNSLVVIVGEGRHKVKNLGNIINEPSGLMTVALARSSNGCRSTDFV
ncbi:hypothetical protein DdX_07122 [Ditylenchus destructor]|uniref:Uncharacterized protein n=1 Tax=Ditylenchus destructor TaxID=166010 RepID=A0AAD4R8N0_9BILA|nr:hypothetical protein DdX_07122 [Ditylenchus destructor]